jgi:hypothetical protein
MKRFFIWMGLLFIMGMVNVKINMCLAQSPGETSNQPSNQPKKGTSEDKGGLTIEQIIMLKKAGISEGTIQLLIEDKQLPQKMKEQAFAQEHIGTWNIKDSQGEEAVIYSTGRGREEAYNDEVEYWRALELLRATWPRPVIRLDEAPASTE